MTIRVLLVDDQPLLRQGFAMIIGAQDDMTVVGEAANGTQAVELARSLRPDVVLMDIRMPGGDGIVATERISAGLAGVQVLVLTTFDLDEYAFAALRAGASGFLLKNAHPHDLVSSIRTVAAGQSVIAPTTTRRLLDTYASTFAPPTQTGGEEPDPLATLTARERDIFTAIAAGLSNSEIATQMTLSEATVKSHVARVLAKLSLRDRIQVVIFSYERGLR